MLLGFVGFIAVLRACSFRKSDFFGLPIDPQTIHVNETLCIWSAYAWAIYKLHKSNIKTISFQKGKSKIILVGFVFPIWYSMQVSSKFRKIFVEMINLIVVIVRLDSVIFLNHNVNQRFSITMEICRSISKCECDSSTRSLVERHTGTMLSN